MSGMYLRYSDSFLSRKGVTWRVDISQIAEEGFGAIGHLDFDADEALVIEWPEREKHESVCGSCATLTLQSPGDRTYTDLYSVTPGTVRMDVYRNGELYWSGTLDPETYEEPYETDRGYDVHLTFSDFGILERKKYMWGKCNRTVLQNVQSAIEMAGIRTEGLDLSLITTRMDDADSPLTLSELSIDSDNWYDEEGEPSTMLDVVEGMLRPLGLRIVQRNGHIWIYDLEGLRGTEPEQVQWSADKQTLSVDKTYSTCKVTFSPYVASEQLNVTDLCGDDKPLTDKAFNRNNAYGRFCGDYQYWTIPGVDYSSCWRHPNNNGFSLFVKVSGQTDGCTLRGGVLPVRFLPLLNGTDKQAVLIRGSVFVGDYNGDQAITAADGGRVNHFNPATLIGPQAPIIGNVVGGYDWDRVHDGVWVEGSNEAIVDVDDIRLPKLDADRYRIRIAMDVLEACTCNPFDGDSDIYNCASDHTVNITDGTGVWDNLIWDTLSTYLNDKGNGLMIPVIVAFTAKNGMKYVWKYTENWDESADMWAKEGGWVAWTGNMLTDRTHLLACQSDWTEKTDEAYVNCNYGKGWTPIRQNTVEVKNPKNVNLYARNDAQYIPIPPGGEGTLKIMVLKRGWMHRERANLMRYTYKDDPFYEHNLTTWLCCTVPAVSVVPKWYGDLDTDDRVYEGTINEVAKEHLDINTVCGTAQNGDLAMARGAYLLEDGSQLQTLSRAGYADHPESLLLNTVYSQYASRHTVIEGEADIDAGDLKAYTERCQDEKRFIKVAETQNCIQDCGDVKIVELSEETYMPVYGV